jgi:putative tricarboxylic transport membrane protein
VEPAERPEAGPSAVLAETLTALFFAAVGALAIWDSRRIGAGWATDGPQAGYFPFWIGLILLLASAGNLVLAWRARAQLGVFASFEQLRLVSTILVPAVLYVGLIPVIGIYLASALLFAYFMRALGGFRLSVALATGAAVALVTFITFEIWFLVALPKGPIETWLGY